MSTPDWIVEHVIDRGPGHPYRYQVSGQNLNVVPGHMDRHFTWDVPSLDNPRYDLAGARWSKAEAV